MILNICPLFHDFPTKSKKELNFFRYKIPIPKKFNPPCIITRPWIYPEFKTHLSTLTRGLNAHKYGNYGDTGGETAAILKLPWKWQVIFKVTHLTKWVFSASTLLNL